MSGLFLGTGALFAIRSEKSFLTCNSLFIIFCHCSCLIKKCKNINKSYKTSCKLLEWGRSVLLLSLFWQRLILCILQEHTRKSVASYSAQRGNLSLFPWWWHNVFLGVVIIFPLSAIAGCHDANMLYRPSIILLNY